MLRVMAAMSDSLENLILDLVEWLVRTERSYEETMDAWRTSCPGLPVWEEATERGLVKTAHADRSSVICATETALHLLKARRPKVYQELQQHRPA
jgi:D-3-phosphoglycerate dehydrogenase